MIKTVVSIATVEDTHSSIVDNNVLFGICRSTNSHVGKICFL